MWRSSPEATIDFVLMRQNGGVEWNVSFARNFNDWELDIVAAFLDQLYSHIPASNDNDGLWWQLKKTGVFDTSSFYTTIGDSPTAAWFFPLSI